MNLIDEDEVIIKHDPGPKRKIIFLIALCVFLLILTIATIIIIKKNAPKKLRLFINNGEKKTIEQGFFLYGEDGKPAYVSIKALSGLTGYDYIPGVYLQQDNDEDTANSKLRGYIQGNKQIIGFEEGNRKVYKTSIGNKKDVLYFQLANAIKNENNELYIALVDLNIGYNVIYTYSKDKNIITIKTLDYESTQQANKCKAEKNTASVVTFNDQKALLYNMVIYQDSNKLYGVRSLNGVSVIVNMYTSMTFDEYTKCFIVSNSNKKYGLIDMNNKVIIDFKYDSMELVSYSPLLYRIQQNKKFGLIDKTGKVIINRDFDKIGIENREAGGEIVLIKNIGDDNLTGVVVYQNQRYGLANLKDGEFILPCEVERIYYKELNNGDREYYVQVSGKEAKLEDYLIEREITTVTLPKNILNRKSD